MFGLSWKLLGGAGLVLALSLAWGARVNSLRAEWKDRFDVLHEQAGAVVIALREASGNKSVTWVVAPGQIVALGESNRALKTQIAAQNESIDQLAAEAVRLRARASELKRIADKAQAQRQSALRELSNMASTPGTRADCLQLLQEAETALDLVREAGA